MSEITSKYYFRFGGVQLTLSRNIIVALQERAYQLKMLSRFREEGEMTDDELRRTIEDYLILHYKELAENVEILPIRATREGVQG